MSYIVATNDLVEVTVVCLDVDQISVNKSHWRIGTTTGTSVTQQEIATALDTLLAPKYKSILNNNASYRGVSVQKILPRPLPVSEFTIVSAGAGTAGGVALPRQTAGLLSFQTKNAGVAYRGRTYLPFPSVTHNGAAGVPTAGYITISQSIGTDLSQPDTVVGAGGTALITPCIWHRPVKGHPKPLDNTTDPINGFTTKGLWATQRRRGSYGRLNNLPF